MMGPGARRWRPLTVAAAAVAAGAVAAGAIVLAGFGQRIAARPAVTAPTASQPPAVAANSGCVQATPVIDRALGVIKQLQRGKLTVAAARPLLAAAQADIGRLARTTSDDVLQQNLAETSDAFTAFLAVLQHPKTPVYQQTSADLAGQLAGFGRMCSVGNTGFENGISGWAPIGPGTTLSRSTTAHQGRWSLEVTNAGRSPARAGFTDSPPSVTSTLKGAEQVGLWARALTGSPELTLRVRELSGSTVVGSRQVRVRLGPAFRFVHLTYQIRRPGSSRLSVTASAAALAPGGAFLVDDITLVRD
jgi:hypothetical protein